VAARLYYGWVVVGVSFVTMAIGINARTAFSLFFPPLLDEFGWDRGTTAGAFSFGFLVSAVLSPALGRLMDRRGPRVVLEMGVVAIGAGLILATFVTAPWHLYVTLGVLVGGGSVCTSYTGQSLYLLNWFVRRRGLATSIAFSGVGVGSIILFPWIQGLIAGSGWRAACWWLGALVLVLLIPLNLLVRRRPEDLGLEPDGDTSARDGGGRSAASNVVDAAWVAVDWTLGRAIRTNRFWWMALGFFSALYSWYAVQVHQTKYLVEIGFGPTHAAWALGGVSLIGVPGQIALGHVSDRIGREWVWTVGSAGRRLRPLLRRADRAARPAGARAPLLHGRDAGHARLRHHLGDRLDRARDLPGPALRRDLRHADGRGDLGRRRRAVGHRRAVRRERELRPGLLDLHRPQHPVGDRDLAGRAPPDPRGGRPRDQLNEGIISRAKRRSDSTPPVLLTSRYSTPRPRSRSSLAAISSGVP
jgi:MFS family permease